MRILHCPTSVGGNAWGLSRAERLIGLDSSVMIYNDTWLGFPYDIKIDISGKSLLQRQRLMWEFLFDSINQYDIFHFNFGSSLISFYQSGKFFIDLPIIKKFKKGIVVTYQGSDARQIDYCIKNYSITPYTKDDINLKADNIRRKKISIFNKYADKIFALNPDLLNVLPSRAEFRPYSKIDLDVWKDNNLNDYNNIEILTVAHAPTNRKIKGTKYILEAIKQLNEEGFPIELLLIENIPNDQVKDVYKKADILIDQLLIGWYGGVALEFMALSKPVIAYIREEDLKYIPSAMKAELPIINANPHNIYGILKQCVINRELLKNKAIESRKYIEKWHNSVDIAMKMKCIYEKIIK